MRLRRAGDQVVTGWSRARAEAIESGQPYQFRFTPDTGTFVIEPWTGLLGSEGSSAAGTTTAGATSTSTATKDTSTTSSSTSSTAASAETSSSVTNTALPDEIVFQSGELAVEDFQSGERSVAALQDAGESLSTPILFFPDGTCTQATIVLQSDVPNFLRLTLRGLTGVARASGVLTREEMERGSRTP